MNFSHNILIIVVIVWPQARVGEGGGTAERVTGLVKQTKVTPGKTSRILTVILDCYTCQTSKSLAVIIDTGH